MRMARHAAERMAARRGDLPRRNFRQALSPRLRGAKRFPHPGFSEMKPRTGKTPAPAAGIGGADDPITDAEFERGITLILESIAKRSTPPLDRESMTRELTELAAMRGRPAFYPYLGSGVGRSARAMLADGRWVLDFALGIGVHLFGHGDK